MTSLRNRLSLALALVLLAAGGLLAIGLQDFPRRLVEDYVLSRLQHDTDQLYAGVVELAAARASELADAAARTAGNEYHLPLSGHYYLIRRGDELVRSRSLWDEELALPPASGEHERVLRLRGPAGQALLVYTKRFPAADGGLVVTVTEDLGRLDAAIGRFRERLLLGLGLALLLLLLLQRALLIRGLAPLADAVAACRRLERGDSAPLDTVAPAEVQPMVDALNRLARHHAQRLGRIRHAAGNLSHALKTPLAVLGQSADELAARGEHELAAQLRAQLDAMRQTIERELRRARLAGGGPAGEGFDARRQLAALADALQRLHRERALDLALDVPARSYPLDREDMLELFGNLLDNACKWARSRVVLRVDEEANGDGECALFATVEDDGPGVDDETAARLGTAGLRTDERRPGHGLGLAIVADIVSQYGGSVRYARAAALGGLRVELRLPLPAA